MQFYISLQNFVPPTKLPPSPAPNNTIQGLPYWGDGRRPSPLAQNLLIFPHLEKSPWVDSPHQIFIPSHQKSTPLPPLSKNFQVRTQ